MTKVLIGVDGSGRSEDAVTFGRALALAAGAPVILSTAHQPEPPQPRLDGHFAHQGLREDAESMLARFALMLLDVEDVERRPLADHSPARALRAAAEHAGAGIVVVGSSHRGRLGRVLPGSTAERLLHGAPCPVAVAPVGFGARGLPEHPVIGCGYEASDEGAAALGAAEELALALDGSLQVTHVIERVDHLAAALHEVEGTVQIGRPADRLIELTETVDLMVVGSRGYGPLRSVLLGGVSGQLIRSAACPVIVVPRGAHTTVGSLFGPPAVAEAG